MKRIVKDEQGNLVRVRKIWDNGGETFDRYSITFDLFNLKIKKWEPWSDYSDGRLACLGLSSLPTDYCGFSQFCSCREGKHLGKRIAFSALPLNIQNHILHRISR